MNTLIFLQDFNNLMVPIGKLDEYTTFKFYGLHSKVHPLGQKSRIYDYILSLNFIFFFSFLGEHLDFLHDFNDLMVSIGRLDEYATLKFFFSLKSPSTWSEIKIIQLHSLSKIHIAFQFFR